MAQQSLLNIFDYERAASACMDPAFHAYFDGGAADNITRDDNRAAFNRIRLLPRVFRDVSALTTSTTVAGHQLTFPVMTAPTAMNKLAHEDGELGVARAAKAQGIVQIVSTMSTYAIEDITAVGHDVWFQLYLFRDREASKVIVQRAEQAGCKALVLTVDVPMIGLRKSLARSNFHSPANMPFPNLMRTKSDGKQELIATMADQIDPSLTWDALDWLRSITNLPIWVKGILRPDDAQLAVQAGVDGIIVSNHGGRQLDTAIASIDALPAIVQAVGSDVPLMMDGGIRRGSDILKAIALGAQAVLLGRAPLWGLAINGEAGVFKVLDILQKEFENVMAQCGCASVAEIGQDLLARPN